MTSTTNMNLQEDDNTIQENEETTMDQLLKEADTTMEDLFLQQDQFRTKLLNREIVNVKVIQVDKDNVLVNIGEKKEGLIPLSDFSGEKNPPAVGSEVSAILDRKGNDDRHNILSHRKAVEMLGWVQCQKAFEEQTRVRGTVLELVKGGYIVEVQGIRGFMPLSLSELHPAYKHHLNVNSKIRCAIIECSREKNRLILSRKQVLEEDEKVRREKVFSEIKEGDIFKVVVVRTMQDSLFVRFHGVESIVRFENLAWREPEKVLASFKRGQRVRAKLLNIDHVNQKLEFGFKQLYSNPADVLKRRFRLRANVKGTVTAITDDGIIIKLPGDTDAIITAEDFGSAEKPNVGDPISATVVGIDSENFRIILSVRRYEAQQNKKIIAQYLKEAPPLTLGQLLGSDAEDDK